MKTAIVIFCDDFRIQDNPAFFHAAKNYENIIPLFIYNENYAGRPIGKASKVFLHHALNAFSSLLKNEYDANLIIKNGDGISELKKIECDAIYFNESYLKSQIDLEEKIKKTFVNKDVKSFKAKLLFAPFEIKNSEKSFYKVFTPFAKDCQKRVDLIGKSVPKPSAIKSQHNLKSLKIDDLKLLPKNEWHKKIIKNWEFDYKKLEKNIVNFAEKKLSIYAQARNIPSLESTSKLSPYLRFGMFSPRIIYHTMCHRDHAGQFILELLWREFAHHVTFYNQDISTKELKKKYSDFEWEDDAKSLKKWQKGETGFELVDAAMRELWQSGFMHGRARMVAASFLIKDLLIDWRIGEQWFYDTLLDACPAVNPFSWQWIFGSGYDAAPYFRIFNPDLQKKRFDEKDDYCKKWLGEGAKHEKIVDHDVRRKVALAKYKKVAG